VNVYDVGIDDQNYYMVMEYIEGSTLKEIIDRQAPLSIERVVDITLQVLAGLAHAHENGIVHRDIKPHNIMLTHDDRVKVTDFGISRMLRFSSSLTKTGTVMGTVHYFSPEQARGLEMGFPSDLYSLGVVLYEMLTGRLPFNGEENIAIALKHIQEPVPNPRKYNPHIPVDLLSVIHRVLEKQPEYRFQTAREMADALQKVTLHDVEPNSVQTTISSHVKEEPSRQSHLTQAYPKRRKKKSVAKKLVIGLISILCLFIFLVIGVKWMKSRSVADYQPPAVPVDNPHTDTKPNTTPESEPKPNTNNPNTNNHKIFKLIAGSFESKPNARKLQHDLKEKGFDSKIVEANSQGKKRYRVQVGQFKSLEEAQAKKDELQAAGFNAVLY
jgi:serine/threonine protein kinase